MGAGDHMSSAGMRAVAVDIAATGNSAAVDAFGRWRVSNPISIFENKNIHDRNKNQWEEPIVGAIIEHGTVTGGPFQVSETITGGTSGTVGTVTAVDGGALTVTYIVNHDDFVVGETITGGTSGATATITTVGTGSTITHDRNNAAVILQVGVGATDSAIRQSHRYLSYRLGKSHLIEEIFLFGEAVTNVRRRVGYFEDANGLFLEQTTDGVCFVRRTKTSGSVVEEKIQQLGPDGDRRNGWNFDTFDGKGPSGIKLDFTKEQFLFIDLQWTGRVRMGFIINGNSLDAHRFNFSNQLDTVFMSTPSLPARFEIANIGVTSGVNTMKEFGTSIVSEGGETITGLGFSVSREVTPRSVTTEVPVLAVRLKSSFGGGDNRKTVQFSSASVFVETNNAHFDIVHIHDPTGITATWTDIGGGSAVEFSTDITAITGNPFHKIGEGYAFAGGPSGKGAEAKVVTGDKEDQHRFLTQNFDSTNSEVFVLFAEPFTGISLVYGTMGWVEFD